jgi:hypothetical protein
MPRTRSSKEDNRAPLEKLLQLDSKIELLMFYQYFDGYSTNGMVGFKTHEGPPGSTKHWGGIFRTAMTKNQFRSKGKKLAILAQAFITNNTEPPPELRPRFDQEEINTIREESRDNRSIAEKLGAVSEILELFVFFKYYDGYNTGGKSDLTPILDRQGA